MAVLLVLALPSAFIAEYGTLGLILAVFGYLLRHRDEIAHADPLINHYMMFSLLSFVLVQQLLFWFDRAQFTVLCTGLLCVMGGLYFFRPRVLSGPDSKTVGCSGGAGAVSGAAHVGNLCCTSVISQGVRAGYPAGSFPVV